MNSVSLHGSYFGRNYGDMLLMAIFLRWIKSLKTNLQVTLPIAPIYIKELLKSDSSGIHSFMTSNGLVYGGGGYFGEPPYISSYWGIRNFLRHIPIGLLAQLLKKPIAVIGVGAGPISNTVFRRAVFQLLNKAQVIAVRDEESLRFLVEYGGDPAKILVTSDAALSLTLKDIPDIAHQRASTILKNLSQPIKIVVHVQLLQRYNSAKSQLLQEIVNWAQKNSNVGILWIQDGFPSDFQALLNLQSLLPSQSISVPYTGYWELSALLGQVDMVITTKLHVGIVASALNTVTLAFPFHTKVPRFYKQIGCPERCIPIHALKSGQVVRQIETYLETTFAIPNQIRLNALQNREVLFQFLESSLISSKKR